jgi:hypothetical protein
MVIGARVLITYNAYRTDDVEKAKRSPRGSGRRIASFANMDSHQAFVRSQ